MLRAALEANRYASSLTTDVNAAVPDSMAELLRRRPASDRSEPASGLKPRTSVMRPFWRTYTAVWPQ